uniref:G-protein coupled receptors family 1 profile domain-containing protein n=1 Tax=Fundulus heteroclitus TaxID=8078 RepID=A0A3Q2Q281_FUNHE
MHMSANSSVRFFVLTTLGLPSAYMYPAFVFGTLTYLIIVFCNLLVILTIVVSKRLHKPMFLLLINLTISDILGASAFFPHLVFTARRATEALVACNIWFLDTKL